MDLEREVNTVASTAGMFAVVSALFNSPSLTVKLIGTQIGSFFGEINVSLSFFVRASVTFHLFCCVLLILDIFE